MGYLMGSGGNLLWVIVWLVLGIFYGLFCREWWEIVVGYCVASVGNLL
jgi:integral membrane sensor domain MASE1